jgi:phytoene desaturase (3,4-didehydrolycopene-forming)
MGRRGASRSPSGSPAPPKSAAQRREGKAAAGGASPSAVVVGAGIGGLAVAGRLRRAGFEVTVLEKNDHAGGRCDTLQWRGHRFDTGPSFILLPDAFQDTFASLGARMDAFLELTRVDPTYTVRFSDGTDPLELTADLGRMQAQLEAHEPGSFQNFLAYIAEGRKGLHLLLRHIAHREWRSALSYFSLGNLPLLGRLQALSIHYRRVSSFFTSPKLRAAFTFQDMYIGLSPYDAPATFALLQATEFCDGVWYSTGGLHAIILALVHIVQDLGVALRCNAVVQSIAVDEDRGQHQKASVVLQDGEVLNPDIVVVTADLPYAYAHLLPKVARPVPGGMSRDPSDLQLSSSTISFFWSLNKEYSQLGHHNMFLATGEYRQSFDQIFEGNGLPEKPSFYINAPSRTDRSMAPPGKDSLTVLVPVGRLSDDPDEVQDWPGLIARARKEVLERLAQDDVGIHDIDAQLLHEDIYTPEVWEQRYNCYRGAAFGLNHHFGQVGYLRPQCAHPSVNNLYFAGSSTHPGSGLPNVLVSARLAVTRILSDRGMPAAPGPTDHDPSLINSRYAPIPSGLFEASHGGVIPPWLYAAAAFGVVAAAVALWHEVPWVTTAAETFLLAASAAGSLVTEARTHSTWYGFRLSVPISEDNNQNGGMFGYHLSYAGYHVALTLPPIAALWLWRSAELRPLQKAALSLICFIAFWWTVPWDNYLVANEVWGYGADRVCATIGYVPIEEYAFFIIQPIMTCLLLFRQQAVQGWRGGCCGGTLATRQGGVDTELYLTEPLSLGSLIVPRWVALHLLPTALLLWLSYAAVGWWLARGSLMYMGLILGWSAPIMSIQWLYGGSTLWRDADLLVPVVMASSIYLWVTDSIAISDGIWWISEKYTTGLELPILPNVPIEEATFFVVTNLMCVQGVHLFLDALVHLQ